MIAQYEVDGELHYGLVVSESSKKIRVWFNGKVIERRKDRHKIKTDQPAMRWDLFYHGPVDGINTMASPRKPKFQTMTMKLPEENKYECPQCSTISFFPRRYQGKPYCKACEHREEERWQPEALVAP